MQACYREECKIGLGKELLMLEHSACYAGSVRLGCKSQILESILIVHVHMTLQSASWLVAMRMKVSKDTCRSKSYFPFFHAISLGHYYSRDSFASGWM